MKNKEIAGIFDRIADILEIIEDNVFRINSYRKAARAIGDLAQDIEQLASEDKLKEIPGIGSGMIDKINQYLTKGKIDVYDQIREKVPQGLVDMLSIPGMGPKTIALIYKKLKIKSIPELEKAINKGKLDKLPGMGKKKEDNILRGIKLLSEAKGRILLGDAFIIANDIIAGLKKSGIKLVSTAGSLRRMKETVGDIDILVGSKKGKDIINKFVKGSDVKEILAGGPTKGSVILADGLQADIRVVEPQSYGSALLYFTGSKEHNIHLREIAKRKGFKINEYGLFKKDKKIKIIKEEDIYKKLGLEYISPLLRENRGEIEAAASGKLPKLVTQKDIKADLHVHSRWSDGMYEITDIANAAKRMGYKYIVISDHSQSLKIAGGLSPARLEKQIKEIRELNKKMSNFTILCGSEVDIKGDGSLDFPDSLLEKLDIVLAAIHTGFKQDKKTLTTRIIKAMENPNVDVIVHPTGRLIGSREPYELDMEEIFRTAKETQTALEINCHYNRLDLNDIWARRAKEMGVKLVLGTDSHMIDQLWMMSLGVGVAGRAWLEKDDILNAFSLKKLTKYLTK